MASAQEPGTIWVSCTRRDRVGRVLATILICSQLGWLAFWWPAEVLQEKHPPVGVFIYLALAVAAIIWICYRAWLFGVRLDDEGVTVCNISRTCRAAWSEVSAFTDGTTHGKEWALNVMLRDGRGITAAATAARPGHPEILIAIRQAAARHGVPAQLTGVAAERPQAWLDAADEARRRGAQAVAWLALAVISVAGIVALIWLGRAHSRAHHVNYYPATIAGGVAVAGLLAARAAWRKRRQFLGRGPVPAQDRCGEGDWFAVPLPKDAGFAPGLIARAEPRRAGLLLCYFFAPIGSGEPTPGQLRGLRAADAVMVQRLDGLAPEWPRLGQGEEWDRGAWPVPAFGRPVKKTSQCFLDIYDDDLRFVGEEVTDRAELDGLLPRDVLSPGGAKVALANLLPKPSDTIPVGRGRRILAWTGAVLLNLVALYIGIGFVGTYLTQGSPAQIGQNYIPLWATVFTAVICGSVPALTAVFAIKYRRSRMLELRAAASDSPEPSWAGHAIGGRGKGRRR